MNVVDLFSGSGSATRPWVDRGHRVLRVDVDRAVEADLHADILSIEAAALRAAVGAPIDFIWASPPCEAFSVAGRFKAWGPNYQAATPKARHAVRLVERTVQLIRELRPTWWVVENPVGLLRKLGVIPASWQHAVVTQCQYLRLDEAPFRMKPTDLWGRWPSWLVLYPPCRNGDPCHERAPRGARTGTQGLPGGLPRARIPYLLGLAFCLAAERSRGGELT